MEKELTNFIDSLEMKIIPVYTESNKVAHEANITGKSELFEKSAELNVKIAKIYSNKKDFEFLKRVKESEDIRDEILKRELDVIYLNYLGNQADEHKLEKIIKAESELENRYTGYRAEIDGQKVPDNKIDEILKNSTNSEELENAWMASKEIGSLVEGDVLQIVKMRNDLARDLGFSNFHEMSLKLSEQDPDEILQLFDELDELTKPAFAAVKETVDVYLSKHYAVPVDQLMPWHYQNKYFQEAPLIYEVDIDGYYKGKDILEVCTDYYNGIGLQVGDIISNSDLYAKEGKNQHAYCTDIDRSGDVRVLANITDDSYWMGTMLHELGHGVYAKYNDMDLPYFLRDAAHIFTTEAIANLFGRFYSDPQWLQDNIGISDEEKEKIADQIRDNLVLEQLVFSRWSQVMYRFEKAMYENPDQDLNTLWWNLVEKYQMIKKPEGRNAPDYAAKIHVALYPCYYHNYLLGQLLASQLQSYIGTEILGAENPFEQSFTGKPEVGEYLIEKVFMPGMRYTWNGMIENATGEKLTAKYYAMQFVR